MIRLEHPDFLYALFLIPLLILVYWLSAVRKRKQLKAFADPEMLKILTNEVSVASQKLKFFFLLLAFAFLILALANPQMGSKMEEVKREGVDVIVALDISNSMLATDILPSRLERARQAISKFVDKLENDRIGIIVFAGNAYVQLPLTTDYGAAKLFASIIDSDMIPTQGTAMGAAIDLSMKSFDQEDKKYKALILITDGENHEDDAIESAKTAADKGVVVHTIGMGSPSGSPIPVKKGDSGFRKDSQGNTIISKLDETLLQQIASAGNGKFIRASASNDGLEGLVGEISKMEKKNFGMKMYTDYEDQFQYFIGIALLFLLFDLFLSEKKSKYISRINLFERKGGKHA